MNVDKEHDWAPLNTTSGCPPVWLCRKCEVVTTNIETCVVFCAVERLAMEIRGDSLAGCECGGPGGHNCATTRTKP